MAATSDRRPNDRITARRRSAASIRPRQRLRQDHARFAPGDDRRRRRSSAPAHRRSRRRSSSEFNTPASRARAGRGHRGRCRRSWRAWPGRPVNVGTLGGYCQLQVRRVLPDRGQPLVDPRPVRHARLRGAARQHGVRRRDAADRGGESRSRSSSATSSPLTIAVAVIFLATAFVGNAFAGPAGRRDQRRHGVRLCGLAVPARAGRRRRSPSRSPRSWAAARRPASPARSCSAASS